jgi:predicted DNA-binding transcriptional regulator AlpA
MEKLWTVQELAEFLDIPVHTIYQWRSKGYGPPGRRIGKYVRFVPRDVEVWVDSLDTRVA